jgi:hemoglobin
MKAKTIEDIADIKLLVDSFYGKVRNNNLLNPVFEQVIQDRWPEHLQKMYNFWETVLLGNHTYFGTPFRPHANLPINEEYFKEWIRLFNETIDEFFEGEKAEEAKWRADKMAELFIYKLTNYRNNPSQQIL